MKKLILFIFTLCLIFGFTACGNEADKPVTEDDLESWTEKDFEDALDALDSADKASDAQNQTTVPAGDSYEAKQEILDAAWDSGLVQIDDILVQLPVNLNEWVDLGLDYEVENGNKSKDYLFANGETIRFNLICNGEEICSVNFTKGSENPETLEDMNPLIENISVIRKPENITMYFPGGLTFGDPYGSIEEKLGKATEVSDTLTYKYGRVENSATDVSYGIKFSVDRDSQTISRVEIGKSIQDSKREALTNISFADVPNAQTSDTHNVTLLWAPEYKEIPGFLVSDRCAGSVLDFNGQKYFMSLSFSMLAQQYASPYDYIEYGDPVLDMTDENGMSRVIYKTDSSYIVVCSTDAHIFKAVIVLENMTDSSEDALTALQDLVLEIADSVQY